MRWRFELTLFVIVFNLALLDAAAASESAVSDFGLGPASDNGASSDISSGMKKEKLRFELSRIDEDVVREFEKAWWLSNNGTNGKEGLVLVFRTLAGSYIAQLQHKTNEQKQVTFTWIPNAIAIVHTHPNSSDPKPSDKDRDIADRFNVPMFTITLHGMYVYDPAFKKTSLVQQGLDWLDVSKWKRFNSSPYLANSSR